MIGPLGSQGERPLPHSLGKNVDDGLPDADLESAMYAWATADGDSTTQQEAVIEAFARRASTCPRWHPNQTSWA